MIPRLLNRRIDKVDTLLNTLNGAMWWLVYFPQYQDDASQSDTFKLGAWVASAVQMSFLLMSCLVILYHNRFPVIHAEFEEDEYDESLYTEISSPRIFFYIALLAMTGLEL